MTTVSLLHVPVDGNDYFHVKAGYTMTTLLPRSSDQPYKLMIRKGCITSDDLMEF